MIRINEMSSTVKFGTRMPNLIRDTFPYEEVPKMRFDKLHIPMDLPDDIFITDTTFRDGQQARAPFTVDQIVALYDLMHKLSGPNGIIRMSEFFLYSERDRKAVEKCLEKGYEFPKVTSWIRAHKNDFALVKKIGIKETGILVSCSDYHIYKKLNLTRKSAAEKYLSVVKMAMDNGITPRCHFEDITRADIFGFVIPFAKELQKLSQEYGIPVKIRACDTLGFGVPYAEASLPRSVPKLIHCLKKYADFDSSMIEWHGHNDFYKVVSNSTAAWLYGASSINCSLLGIGERTGNCPLEAMAIEYSSLKGSKGMDLSVITEIAEYFENEIGYSIPDSTPFVGKSFNVTRAGIHADGLLKNEEIYNIFDTTKILDRAPMVAVGQSSGLAGIAHWINKYFRLSEDEVVGKRDAIVLRIKELLDKEYEAGRTTAISDQEMEELIKKIDPEFYSILKNPETEADESISIA